MITVKVVSDLICPWCYIGKRRLEMALRQLAPGTLVSVSWHPFQLNPEMPLHGMDRNEYRRQKFGDWSHCQKLDAQLTEVGKSVGIGFRFDLQSNTPNTFDAHRVIWLAGELGLQDEVVEGLFKGYFCEGVNFSSRADLIERAAAAGLDPGRLQTLLNSEEGAVEVRAQEQEIKGLGISAVPLFIIEDSLAVSGAQPPEVLLAAFEQALNLTGKSLPTSEPRPRPSSARETIQRRARLKQLASRTTKVGQADV